MEAGEKMDGMDAYIVDVVRTPFGRGRESGSLASAHPVDLLSTVLIALQQRTGLDPVFIEDTIVGCVQQVGEQAGNIARHAVLASGWPSSVPGVTLDRKCGSFQQAVHFAAATVASGQMDVIAVGGVEMMSRVPMKLNRMGRDELGPRFHEALPEGLVGQGISAEIIAGRWNIDRLAMDEYAATSHQQAALYRDNGLLARDIVPVTTNGSVVTTDEGIRDTTTVEILSGLKAAYERPEMSERFPEIRWGVTAGNSSQITDGAAATLVVSERALLEHSLTPRARIVATSAVGDDPILMLTGVIPATEKVLRKAGLNAQDMDTFEVNEAFASVVLAWESEFDIDRTRVNPWGGAIAFGHPVGASGGRLLAQLVGRLEETRGRYGLWTMCESGGMANATIIERYRP
jgi:acetyl-CoA acyltransferase